MPVDEQAQVMVRPGICDHEVLVLRLLMPNDLIEEQMILRKGRDAPGRNRQNGQQHEHSAAHPEQQFSLGQGRPRPPESVPRTERLAAPLTRDIVELSDLSTCSACMCSSVPLKSHFVGGCP